jgi:hypothetical protein
MTEQTIKDRLPDFRNMVHSFADHKKAVDELRNIGRPRGYPLGFKCLKDYYTILPGKTTYIYGPPFSGKSYLWFEFLINLSEYEGLKNGIFSEEMGKPHEVFWDLVQMVARVNVNYKLYDGSYLKISQADYDKACEFVREYFYIISPSNQELSITEFFQMPDVIQSRFKVDINTLTGDPFNEFSVNQHEIRYRDLWIGDQLKTVRRQSELLNIHTCIINHASDQQKVTKKIKDTKQEFEYYPVVTPRELFGGQEWYRKGMGMMSIWRPPVGFPDENGIPALENEIWIIIQKSKPRGMGKNGIIKLYLDHAKHRYYEETTFGNKFSHKVQDDSMAPERIQGSSLRNDIEDIGSAEFREKYF